MATPNGAAALLDGCRAAAERSAGVRRARAARHARAVAPMLAELSAHGVNCREMAVALNGRGVPSPSGQSWYPEQVRRTSRKLELAHVL